MYDNEFDNELRDKIAIAALTGMLAHSTRYKPREEGADWHWSIAKEAYELADAMIKAREASECQKK